MNDRSRKLLLLMLCVIIWASSYSITKAIVKDIPPIFFAFLRFIVASIVIFILSIRKPIPPHFIKEHWKSIVGLSLTGVALYYVFFNLAFVYTTASAGALIQGFIPAAVVLLATIFLKEKLNLFQWIGILLSVAGVVVMSLGGKEDATAASPLTGNLLMVASVFLWAGYTVISKHISKADTAWLTATSTILGTILLLPATLIELWGQPLPVLSWEAIGVIIYLGAFASALSYYWYNLALTTLPASTVGVFLNIDPIIGAAIAMIFLGESISVIQIIGVSLIAAGIWLSNKKQSDQAS